MINNVWLVLLWRNQYHMGYWTVILPILSQVETHMADAFAFAIFKYIDNYWIISYQKSFILTKNSDLNQEFFDWNSLIWLDNWHEKQHC